MKLERYNEVRKAAAVFAVATENGCRNIEKREHQLVMDWVKASCRERLQGSKYLVYTYTDNLGNRTYPDRCRKVDAELISDFKETEKSFCNERRRILKTSIIGWLS